jgi:hypothetical protein
MHRRDPAPVEAPHARAAVAPQPLARTPIATPPSLAWASAAGSQRVQRLAAALGESDTDDVDVDVDVGGLEDDSVEGGEPDGPELEDAELDALVARLEAVFTATPPAP